MLDGNWEPFWTILLLATGSIYLGFLGRVRRGIAKLPKSEALKVKQAWFPMVSVIIPCRNEAKHIGAALDDLSKQDYPGDRLQIIVVNDRSTDETREIASQYNKKVSALKVINVSICPNNVSPKKNAIMNGIESATGEIIITTDGDCRFSTGWVSSLIGTFSQNVGVVTGLTIFDRQRREPFWQRLQQLDYLSHSFFAAGVIGSGQAFNCNGSNLALRREAFEDVEGYKQFSEVITGDDTLLLQKIRRSGKWRIRFCADPENIVHSWPEETPSAVLNQRLRWGSGGLSYSYAALVFALLSFIFFTSLFLSPIFWGFGLVSGGWFILFMLKIIQEGRVMSMGWKIFRLKPDWFTFLILELIHIPAILSFSTVGHLWGFHWKGQRFKRTREPAIKASQTANP